MKRSIPFLLLLAASSCKAPEYIHKGVDNGVELSYRWKHPPGKPSELLLRLKNISASDRGVSLEIDLSYQGLTVETLQADTCIRPGATLDGKLNGIYFRPERLTAEQIKSGDTRVELSRFEVTPQDCP